jgi:hypothetical protein
VCEAYSVASSGLMSVTVDFRHRDAERLRAEDVPRPSGVPVAADPSDRPDLREADLWCLSRCGPERLRESTCANVPRWRSPSLGRSSRGTCRSLRSSWRESGCENRTTRTRSRRSLVLSSNPLPWTHSALTGTFAPRRSGCENRTIRTRSGLLRPVVYHSDRYDSPTNSRSRSRVMSPASAFL